MKKCVLVLAILAAAALLASTANADVIFHEDFNGGLNGWNVNDNNNDSYAWEHSNVSIWNFTGGSGGFAIADSYNSWADDWNDRLVSPLVDITGLTKVTLSACVSYEHDITGGYASVAYSVDNGTTWDTLQSWNATYQGRAGWEIDLANNSTGLLISFYYSQPGWSYYSYQVDDVAISAATVPEPASVLLFTCGAVSLSGSKKKARKE